MTRLTTSAAFTLARAACACVSLVAATAIAAPSEVASGVLLRQGTWGQGVGSYGVPPALEKLPARSWPMDGWAMFVIDDATASMTVQPLKSADARRLLKPIVDQLEAYAAGAPEETESTPEMPAQDLIPAYVRIPGVAWRTRNVALYRFKNGTHRLTPALDHRFELALAGHPFAFTLQNGLRTADGRPYGEGTQFSLELDGQRYDYNLGGYGWDVRIEAIGDFDGDGRPDFLFELGGSNSEYEALVLSSQARPGRNAPTAYLSSYGC